MKVRAEVTIDLDEKRRIWSEVSADCDPDEVADVSRAAAESAIHSYAKVVGRREAEAKEKELATFSGRGSR